MLGDGFELNGAFYIGDWLPNFGFLDRHGWVKKMKALNQKFDQFLSSVIDEHQARRKMKEDFVAKDVVDALLQLAKDPNLEVELMTSCLKALIQV